MQVLCVHILKFTVKKPMPNFCHICDVYHFWKTLERLVEINLKTRFHCAPGHVLELNIFWFYSSITDFTTWLLPKQQCHILVVGPNLEIPCAQAVRFLVANWCCFADVLPCTISGCRASDFTFCLRVCCHCFRGFLRYHLMVPFYQRRLSGVRTSLPLEGLCFRGNTHAASSF